MPTGEQPADPSGTAAQAELRALCHVLLQRREEERTRVAQQIHNEVGQSLTAIKMALKGVQRQINLGQAPALERLTLAETLLDEAIGTVRRIATDLRPGLLDHFGLGAAAEWQMQQWGTQAGLPYQLQMNLDENRLPRPLATIAFRILQGALATVSQRAVATLVTVNLTTLATELLLTLEERIPVAATPDQPWPALLLLEMHECAQPVGGRVDATPVVAGGTLLVLRLPLPPTIEDRL